MRSFLECYAHARALCVKHALGGEDNMRRVRSSTSDGVCLSKRYWNCRTAMHLIRCDKCCGPSHARINAYVPFVKPVGDGHSMNESDSACRDCTYQREPCVPHCREQRPRQTEMIDFRRIAITFTCYTSRGRRERADARDQEVGIQQQLHAKREHGECTAVTGVFKFQTATSVGLKFKYGTNRSFFSRGARG